MVSTAIERLRDVVDEVVSEEIAGAAQGESIVELWRIMARLDAQFARRLMELDRSAEWSADGARSLAGWLAARTRCASGEAHHRVRVARQVAEMSLASAAWEHGEIGTSHVAALAKVRHAADADASFAVFEPALVDVARAGRPDDVANTGKQWRHALDDALDRDGAAAVDRDHERRGVHFSRSTDGIGILDGTFDSEGAEVIEKALKRSYDRAHEAGDPRTPAQQRSDAMVEIFRHYLDDQPRGTNRPHIVYVVGVDTIGGEAVGICETLDGRRVSPETLRRIACDSIGQVLFVDGDGVPLAMGRATRTFTPDQYRAIMVRDGGCRWFDCDAPPDDCEIHHGAPWELGGLTDVDNGWPACKGRGHHRLVHEGGWTVRGDPNGELEFYDPDGNLRGTSRPRKRPPPILTRTGRLAELAHERIRALAA